MRVFWGCMAILAGIGLWILLDTGETGRASDAPVAVDQVLTTTEAPGKDNAASTSSDVGTSPPVNVGLEDPASTVVTSSATDVDPSPSSATAADTGTAPLPGLDLFGMAGGSVLPSAPPRTLRTDDRRPSDIVRRIDERTLELDGRFRLTGNGSDADPYLITWEMLTSASEYVDPAQDARTPPPWVRLLDGTYVEISGYYSTAVRVALAKNLLLTLNRWDGCCIGVPPTPYDAVEVRLASEIRGWKKHTINFGSIEGIFRVEPYLVENWLVGLYLIEDGKLDTEL